MKKLSKAESIAIRTLAEIERSLRAGRWDSVRDHAIRLAALAEDRARREK
jgi:hypothetical protein